MVKLIAGRSGTGKTQQMVSQINDTVVDPVLQLDPVVYAFEAASGKISIAASAI